MRLVVVLFLAALAGPLAWAREYDPCPALSLIDPCPALGFIDPGKLAPALIPLSIPQQRQCS